MSDTLTTVPRPIKYDHERDEYCARFNTTPSEAIPIVIAEISGVDTLDLEPLYDTVDPDALDWLFSDPSLTQPGDDLSVVFSYAGYEVIVRDGILKVAPSENGGMRDQE